MTTYDQSPRRSPAVWVPTLFFAEGFPYFVVVALAGILYKKRGMSNDDIALYTNLLLWPWSLKPIWGPLIEMFKTKKFFIILMQLLGGVSLTLVALTLPLPNYLQYSLLFLGIAAFCSSTHDIAADGLYITSLSKTDQANYVGWLGAVYNIGRVLATGGLVVLAGRLERQMSIPQAWMIVFGLAGAILIALGIYHARVLPAGGTERRTESFDQVVRTFGDVVVSFLRKPSIWLFLIFIFLFRAGEGQIGAMGRLFLLDGREVGGLGLSTDEVGTMYGTFGTICFVVGSILGGRFTASLGLKKALLPLIVIMNLPNAAFLYLAIAQPTNVVLVTTALCVEMFGYGFGFVGLTLLMMQEVAPGKYEAAHYAICTSVMNFGYMVPGMLSGKIQLAVGYPRFFTWTLLAAIPALVVSRFLPFRAATAEPAVPPAAEPAQA